MERKTNEKKVLVLSFLGVITLIVVVVGATYAYFIAQGGGLVNTNVNVQSSTTDNLSFQVGSAINITASEENFAQNMGNKTGSTFARATLTANNATNNATRNYYVYLDITSNDFEYTTGDNQGEILLKITDPDGAEVTTLGSLERKTSGTDANQVTGFDITTSTGLITIADNYEIVSTGTETQEWQVEVIFVNLASDQNANTGKTFAATLIIQEEQMQTKVKLASYITDTLYIEDGVNGLYYHDGQGTYTNADQEAGDNSYRFSGGDYQVTEKAIGEGLTRLYTTVNTENDGVINSYCNGSKSFVGNTCDLNYEHYYTTAYDETTHYDTLEETLNQAVIDGYLTADNIKNFICFGTGAESGDCSENNLYRIMGVFNGQAKLIKYDYANSDLLGTDGDYLDTLTTYFWSGKLEDAKVVYRYNWNNNAHNLLNNWNQSYLNTINLNLNYWKSLGQDWQRLIANYEWKATGNALTNIRDVSVKNVYINEIINPTEETLYEDEISLMYVSDYMYAVDPSGWLNIGKESIEEADYRAIKGDNWMYMGWAEWTITKVTDRENYSYYLSADGDINVNPASTGPAGARPVFYLNSNVQIYEGHAGTASDPYRIVI